MKSLKFIVYIIVYCVFTVGYSQTQVSKPLLKIEIQEGKIVNVAELHTTATPDRELQAGILEPSGVIKKDSLSDMTVPSGNDASELNSIPDDQRENAEPEIGRNPADEMEVGKLPFDPSAPAVEKEPYNPLLRQNETSNSPEELNLNKRGYKNQGSIG